MLLLQLLLLHVTKAEIDELLVKYLEDTVTQSQADAEVYQPPSSAYQYQPSNHTITEYGTYDYIIVGAGSAGAVLATRLSENQDVSILLVEAGGRASTFVNIAGMMGFLQRTEYNWNFHTEPQSNCCLGMVDQQCFYPRGRGLGGSSLINALMYVRGNKHDYNSWTVAGNNKWSYTDVLPFFIKSENLQTYGDHSYHGKGGLLNVEHTKPVDTIRAQFLKANQEVGRKLLDYNGKYQLGVSSTQQNVINGRRQHTAKAFLEKAENRPNLKVITHSYATKVEIDNRQRARSILFDSDEKSLRAYARKEVILSAGTFGSPQLLMLSGIGPTYHLNDLKIPVVKNLPVGQNLQEHVTFWGLFITTDYTDPLRTLTQNIRDFINGYGDLTVAGSDALGFLRTKSSRTPKDVPNIEVLLEPINRTGPFEQKIFNYDNETFEAFWSPINPRNTFRIMIALLKPQSRGSVMLKSSSPYEYPVISPNFLSDKNDEDIQALYEGIMEMVELLNTTAFKQINAKLYYKVLPQCQSHPYFSKEQWYCQIRHLSSHLHHPVGTCKMGPRFQGGVVDDELRVHGIDHLRVVDASIIPEAICGHTSAPAIMIAEKVANMLNKN